MSPEPRPPSLRRLAALSLDRLAALLPPAWTGAPRNDAGLRLSPLLHWLHLVRERLLRAPELAALTPEQARQKLRDDVLPLRAGYAVQAAQELRLVGASGELDARLYVPTGTDTLPCLLIYFHGGGFVIGDLDTHDDVCRLLCRESGMQVLSVAYRLAPEHPFPAAVEDAVAAVRWAQAHAARFGVAENAIAVGGDSAGGNLAAVASQLLVAEGWPPLAQLLIYPGTDRVTPRPSQELFGTGFFLSFDDREWFYRQYLGDDDSLGRDPRVSPLLNDDPGPLPPALLVSAGFDVLRDEGEAYAEHLRRHGNAVELMRAETLGHGFVNLASVHHESERYTIRLAHAWRRLCNRALSLRAGS